MPTDPDAIQIDSPSPKLKQLVTLPFLELLLYLTPMSVGPCMLENYSGPESLSISKCNGKHLITVRSNKSLWLLPHCVNSINDFFRAGNTIRLCFIGSRCFRNGFKNEHGSAGRGLQCIVG